MDLGALYTQFVLRDLISYMGPGSIVCLAVGARVLGGLDKVASQVKDLPRLAWLPVLAAFYMVGLAIQGLAFDVFRPNPIFRYYVVSDDKAFNQQLIDYRRALSARPEVERTGLAQQRERFAALKGATANGAVAVLIASVLLLSAYWMKPTLTMWRRGIFMLILVLATVGLWFSHYRLRHSQHDFERQIINEEQNLGAAIEAGSPTSIRIRDWSRTSCVSDSSGPPTTMAVSRSRSVPRLPQGRGGRGWGDSCGGERGMGALRS